jgi:hypothetical protein
MLLRLGFASSLLSIISIDSAPVGFLGGSDIGENISDAKCSRKQAEESSKEQDLEDRSPSRSYNWISAHSVLKKVIPATLRNAQDPGLHRT